MVTGVDDGKSRKSLMHDASPKLTIWHVVAPFDEELGVGHERQAGEPGSFAYVFSSQSWQYESRVSLVFPAGLVRDWGGGTVVRWGFAAASHAGGVVGGWTSSVVGQCQGGGLRGT